jgi:LysM repeat protein
LSCLATVCFYNYIYGEQIIHKVDERDTLFGLSLLYNASIDQIKEINNLQSEVIRKGEELIIPLTEMPLANDLKEARIQTYKVKPGDSLSEIAQSLNIEMRQLKQLNKLSDNLIRTGQLLQIPGKAQPGEYYQIKSGDTLSRLSLLFDVPQDQIRQMNDINSENLIIGQKLLVSPKRPQTYTVEPGDNLWDLARTFEISTDQLISYNRIANDQIYPGQELKLYPYTIENFSSSEIKPVTRIASYRETPLKEYMNYEDDRDFQPSATYAETRLDDPYTNYIQAREILNALDKSIKSERRLSNDLDGYHIVLDPGHGGLDPGAIVTSENGNGETVYVVEDEYAYDITLRTYRLLKLHGADVTLTIISPNHQIRSSSNPSKTFVNMKNEVYNLSSLNRRSDDSCWPVGGSAGLRKRVEIAEDAFKGVAKDQSLYISIHADNSPDHGQGSMVLYSSEEETDLKNSIELAEALVPFLGASSTTGSQNLAVLRDNPAWAEVLIEIRNLHYSGNSWAIRYDKLREQDAEFITAGIINYAKNR